MAVHAIERPSTKPTAIAIVGSTGFLGPFVVAALLRKHRDSKILCLNRSDNGKQRTISALQQIDNSSLGYAERLHFYTVDITEANLGLDDSLRVTFASEVDEVIFNAWNPNWGIPLESFGPLLRAVRSAIDICHASPRRPRLLFMSSTCAIADWSQMHPDQPLMPEEPAWDNASATDKGYGLSKCQAEQLLAQAHARFGLCVSIVRAGQIGGPSSSHMGSQAWPIQGSLYVIIRTSQRLGCWPKHVNALDWIPVDALAAGIANATATARDDSDVRVFNMLHPDPAPWALFYQTLKDNFGLTAKEVSLAAWLDALNPQTFKMHAFFRKANGGRERASITFENSNALRVLPCIERITEGQLEGWLKGWKLRLEDVEAKL
jgi:thioester reductase-like protein